MLKRIKLDYLVLLVIILLGFIVRLYKIDNPIADWHSFRQADTASVTRLYLTNGLDLLMPRYHDLSSIQSGIANPNGFRFVEFPLYNAFVFAAVKFAPIFTMEVWSRLVSVLSAVGTALILYLLGRRYLDKTSGILAAFFYMFIPYNIYFTRVILPEPLAVFLGISAVLIFMLSVDKNKLSIAIVSGILFAFSLLVKPFTIFYAIPMVAYAASRYGLKRVLLNKKYWLFAAVSVLPLLLWRLWMAQFPAGIPFAAWLFNGDHIRFRPSFWRWIFIERLGILILGVWGGVFYVIGLFAKYKFRLQLWLALAALLYVIVVATANVRHDYYQILVIPAVSLMLGCGVTNFVITGGNRLLKSVATAVLIALMIYSGSLSIKGDYTVNHPEIIEAGSAADKLLPKNALVIAPYNGDTAFLYQTGRSGWPIVDTSLEDVIKRGAQYLVSVDKGEQNTKLAVSKFTVLDETQSYVIVDLTKPKK